MIHLRTCIGVEYDLPLIPHFIEYYKSLGVDDFYITLSSPTKKHENLQTAISILAEYDIKPSAIWLGPYREHIRNQHLHKMISHLNSEEWILTADCDEFQEYPSDLHTFSSKLDEEGSAWVQGGVIDRVSIEGEIPKKLDHKLTLSEQFPVHCNMHRLKPEPKGGAIINNEKFMPKVMLHKKNITLTPGNHLPIDPHLKNNKRHKEILKVNHFKWFGDVVDKMEAIFRLNAGQNGKTIYLNQLRSAGRINLNPVKCDD